MAHRALGSYYAWMARRDSSEYHFAKALNQLDRVTEREHLLIQASFYEARDNWDAAIRARETYVERYPDDLAQRYTLGSTYMWANRHQDAIRTLHQVVQIDSTYVSAWVNLATAYSQMGDYAAAVAQYRHAFAIRPDHRLSGNLNHEFGFAFVQLGEVDSAEATFNAMLDKSVGQQASGERSLALLRMFQGRYAEARSHLERAVTLTQTRSPVSEFRNDLYLAMTYASTGRTGAFRRALRDAAAIADTVFLAPGWLMRLASGYARLGDTLELRRLVPLIEQRVTEGSTTDQAAAAFSKALLALARGEPEPAVALLQQAILAARTLADEYRPWLGVAYRLAGEPIQAESTYVAILATKGPLGWEAQEGWILAHYELGKLYEERGDTARAVDLYHRFLAIWRGGDADLEGLADARKRLESLAGPG